MQVYRTLRERREQHELVMEERREYRWILGEDKQISEVDGYDKLASQHLVEECMIAANKCAARFLRDAAAPGPFVVHQGFRADRTEEASDLFGETPRGSERYSAEHPGRISRHIG